MACVQFVIFNQSIYLLKALFIYLTEIDTAREGTQAGGVGEGEAGFLLSREPDPRPRDHDLRGRQTLKRLSHQGAPAYYLKQKRL